MSQISFEVTCNGAVNKLEEIVNGTSIGDLIVSLKAMKDSSNEALTKLLQKGEQKAACQAAENGMCVHSGGITWGGRITRLIFPDAMAIDDAAADDDEEKEEPHKRRKM